MRLALLLALVACHKPAPHHDDAAAPRDAPVDALACTGSAADCAACGSGNGSACFAVAIAQDSDHDKFVWYDRGCKAGNRDSCDGVSWYYMLHGTHEDFERANARVYELRAAELAANRAKCDAHDEQACLMAGVDIGLGLGSPKDVPAGIAILDASCNRGFLDACDAVDVVAKDAKVSDRYSRRACTGGRVMTCSDMLGLSGVDPHFLPGAGAFARRELTRLCDARNADACDTLGGSYWMGAGGAKNHALAAAALARACALEPSFCDDRDRFAHGDKNFNKFQKQIDDATLNLGPLIDATNNGKKPTR